MGGPRFALVTDTSGTLDIDQLSDILERRESAALESRLQQPQVKGRWCNRRANHRGYHAEKVDDNAGAGASEWGSRLRLGTGLGMRHDCVGWSAEG